MKAVVWGMAAALMVMLAGLGYDRYAMPTPVPEVAEEVHEDPVPAIALTKANGQPLGWGDITTPYIVLNIWASWCAPCKEEFPLLSELAADHPDSLTLLAVSVDASDADMQRFLDRLDPMTRKRLKAANVVVVRDVGQQVAQAFQVYRYPESYLIGPGRTIEQKFTGLLRPGDIRIPD